MAAMALALHKDPPLEVYKGPTCPICTTRSANPLHHRSIAVDRTARHTWTQCSKLHSCPSTKHMRLVQRARNLSTLAALLELLYTAHRKLQCTYLDAEPTTSLQPTPPTTSRADAQAYVRTLVHTTAEKSSMPQLTLACDKRIYGAHLTCRHVQRSFWSEHTATSSMWHRLCKQHCSASKRHWQRLAIGTFGSDNQRCPLRSPIVSACSLRRAIWAVSRMLLLRSHSPAPISQKLRGQPHFGRPKLSKNDGVGCSTLLLHVKQARLPTAVYVLESPVTALLKAQTDAHLV